MPRSDNRIALPAPAFPAPGRQPAAAGSTGWPTTAYPIRWLAAIATLWLLLAPLADSAHAAVSRAAHSSARHGHKGHTKHRAGYHGRHAAHALLFGDAVVEPLHYALAPGRSEAFRLRAHASGRVGALRLYLDAASTARAVMVGLYDDSHGRPGVLLAGGSTTAPRHGGWSTIRLAPAHNVSAGGHYWLTILADGGTVDYRARRLGRCPRALSLRRNLRALPATASAARIRRHTHCPISAYAVEASANAPGAPVNLSAPVVAASPPGSNPLSSTNPLAPVSALTSTPTQIQTPGEKTKEPSEKEPHEEPPHEEEHREEPPSEEPAPSAPANSDPPTVGGSLIEGDVLTSTPGTWSGAPTSYGYHWQDCNAAGKECQAIAGATSSSHTLTAGDVGHTIRVVVTATNEGGSTSVTSAATGVVTPAPPPPAPTNTKAPTLSGTPGEGHPLSANAGSWTGSPTAYSYQWQGCNASGAACTNIAGATSSSYTLTAADVGHTIRVVVTATNTGGSTPATSAPSAVIEAAAPPPLPPANTKPPSIGGTATQGHALTATKGSWTENPTSYAYRWQDCDTSGASCTNIAGAAASSYTLTESDVGHTIRVVVTATNAGGSTQASSAPSATVAASSGGSGYPACTQTIGTGANVASTVSGAAAGAVICLSSGDYGSLTLNTTHSGDVTLQAAPAAHVTTGTLSLAGSHLVIRGLWIDGEVKLEEGTSFVTIDRDDISNEGGGGEGIVFDTSDCTVPNAPTWSGCEPHAAISDVTISGNHFHDIGQSGSEDAIHLDNWRNVTVTGNEFDHVIEGGSHTDCLQSVYGGEGLTFDHNYEHDNDCQGIFIKDGDAKNVSVTDNLFLRDNEGTYADFSQLWNIQGLTFQHNTIWDGKGMALVSSGASFTPSATIDHNLISNFSLNTEGGPAYAITEGSDIFGEAPNRMGEGPGDSVNANPQFKGTSSDDYRLASNPNGIGIDWSPAEQQYGPAS